MKKLARLTKRRIFERKTNPRRGKRSGHAAGFEHFSGQAVEFEYLAENTGLNICRYDLDCRLCYMNTRIAELLGVDRRKVIGREAAVGLFPDGRFDAYDRALRQVVDNGRTIEIELSMPIEGGGHHLHLVRFIAENDASGRRRGVLAIGRDITEDRRAEESLRAREREFRSLAENAPDNVVRYGKDCRVIFANRAALSQNVPVIPHKGGLSQSFDWGETLREHKQRYTAALERVIGTGIAETVEVLVPSPEHDQRTHEIKIAAERDENDQVTGAIVFGRDITERKRMDALLMSREREIRSLAENVPDLIIRFDRDGRRTYFNTAYLRATGCAAEDLLGKTLGEVARLTGKGREYEAHVREVLETGRELSLQLLLTTEAGPDRHFHARYCPERDTEGQVAGVLFVARDMTEVYEYQAKIHSLAYFDTLTSLPNRLHFNERITSDLARARQGRYSMSVLILDLDRFKTINDTLGHVAGDQLLCEVARRLTGCVRPTDCVARLGGDEFTIVLPRVNDISEVVSIANRILAAVSEPVLLDGQEFVTSMSIGVATYPNDAVTENELIRFADAALYCAKSAGRNNVQFHTQESMAPQ
ncbi:diguanylate cyclase [Caballeronia sp. SEWSISQ10-4 2]|uniref:sensor domain-containing protein n=1 Tax=Caballeronia sp. SEWSISQ10-4 2 TaxID=2937438 RepID=UPI0026568628|nr:diguanylate cyclase [Caballeronia sp. SEWSISQ10-4 2]MDN7176844.1 diguanylate cyclase [Caballeronia sp. SEWSISQ10-4 2]